MASSSSITLGKPSAARANAIPAGDEHITLAHGRDYGDVSLLAGVLKTSGAQESSQSVDVVALD